MEITKEGAQSLRMKMPNARVVFERTHSYLRLLPACSKIARTNIKVGKTRLLFNSEHMSKFSTDLLVEWAMIRNFVEMTGAVATKEASVTKLHVIKCCLSIFTKIKLLVKNRDSSMVFSVFALLLKCNFCLCNIFWCLLSNNLSSWEFVYFRKCFVGL